jgi:hypothetical protein
MLLIIAVIEPHSSWKNKLLSLAMAAFRSARMAALAADALSRWRGEGQAFPPGRSLARTEEARSGLSGLTTIRAEDTALGLERCWLREGILSGLLMDASCGARVVDVETSTKPGSCSRMSKSPCSKEVTSLQERRL